MSILINGIVMWSGSINEIPERWVLCDGNNGTPDLRDKFVIGAGNAFNFLYTGGSVDTAIALHAHTVSGTTSSNTISHGHFFSSGRIGPGDVIAGNRTAGTGTNKTVVAGGSHAHSITLGIAGEGEDGLGKNLPPYYALAYIMQIN